MAQPQKRKGQKKQKRSLEQAETKSLVTGEDELLGALETASIDPEGTEEAAEHGDAVGTGTEPSLAEEISSMYDIEDEEAPIDMTRMDQKSNRKKWFVVFGVVLLVCAGAAYAGYRFFTTTQGTVNDVELNIRVEQQVASGDLVTIEIEYVNKKNVDIASGDIELFYPDGFFVQRVEPEAQEDSNNRIWKTNRIKPGAGGKIRITGQLVGQRDNTKEFSALLTYQPENFLHDFQTRATASTRIASSTLEVKIELPNQTASGTEVVYKASYTNTSTIPLQNLKAVVSYPKTFTFASASEEPSFGNNEWRVDELQPEETKTIEIKGSLEGKSGSTKQFDFTIGIVELDNSFNVQLSQSSLIVIVNPEVELNISAPAHVRLGEDAEVTVTIKNISDATIKELKTQVSFNGAAFSETEKMLTEIKTLGPAEEQKQTITIPLKKTISGSNQQLEIVAKVFSARVEGKEVSFPNQASATMKIAGSFSAGIEGRYFDDSLKKIGSGPLPPKANNETTYVIRWNVENGSNDVESVRVSTVLPEHVVWKGNESGDIVYDSEARQVLYTASALPARTSKTLEFSVSISPTFEDIDSLLVLTEKTEISAIDSFTEEKYSETADRITTDLPNDEGAKGKGIVEKT